MRQLPTYMNHCKTATKTMSYEPEYDYYYTIRITVKHLLQLMDCVRPLLG